MRSRLALLALPAALVSCAAARPTPPPSTAAWLDLGGSGVARLFEREARDLLPFAFSSSDGRYTGEALSARPIVFASPKGPDEVPTFSGLLEGDETFECSVHAGKIAPGERIHNTVAALEKGAQIRAVMPVEVQLVRARPLFLVEILYAVAAPSGPQVGDYQLAFYTQEKTSLICVHDGAGYRESFASAARRVAETFQDKQAEAAPVPRYAALYSARLGGHIVGYGEEKELADNTDGSADTASFNTLLLPDARNPGQPIVADVDRYEVYDAHHILMRLGAALYRGGEWTEVKVSRSGETSYDVKGTQGDRPLTATVETRAGLRQIPAAELLAVLAGAQTEAKADVYSPVHPLELQRVFYRPSPETPGLLARVAESEQGPRIEANMKLDAHGALERDTSPLPNGAALILTRIWSMGTPR